MANVREQVRLSPLHHPRAGRPGPAVSCGRAPTRRSSPRCGPPTSAASRCWCWAGGSNLVISDDGFPGTVIQVATKGVHRMTGPDEAGLDRASPDEAGRAAAPGAPVTLTVAAGEDWDTVVASCVAADLAGLECLSGIPGLTGATPIQNVGAYGQEVADTITRVRAYDRATDQVVDLAAADCGFGYRTSAFKRSITPRRDRPVRGARRDLPADQRPAVHAGPLRRAGRCPGGRSPVTRGRRRPRARSAVLGLLRRGKGMVLDPADPDTRSAGSFFTNPVLDAADAGRGGGRARARCGAGTRVPHFPAGDGLVKVPAAWLIGQAGFGKGYSLGDGRPDLGQAHAGAGQPGRPARPAWWRWPARSGTGSMTPSACRSRPSRSWWVSRSSPAAPGQSVTRPASGAAGSGVGGVVHVVDRVLARLDGQPEQGARSGGDPELSSCRTAIWVPDGVTSTRFPSPPLTVRMSPPGAMTRPSSPFR